MTPGELPAPRFEQAVQELDRILRDLEDGTTTLEESLTRYERGVALLRICYGQLQTAEQLLDREPRSARRALEEVRRLIAEEQRDLRFYIDDLKPTALDAPEDRGGLDVALGDLGRRLGRVWGMRVVVEPVQPSGAVPPALFRDVYRLIQEASVNAARHGKASEVRVSLLARGDWLEIAVADDGCGFPFQGSFDHDALAARHLGPRTLRERVTALGGTLALESAGTGARLEIRVPLAAAAA